MIRIMKGKILKIDTDNLTQAEIYNLCCKHDGKVNPETRKIEIPVRVEILKE